MIKNSISLSIFLLAASLSLQAQIDSSKLNLDSIPFLELDLDISKLPASFDNFGTRKLDYSNRDRYQSKDFNPGIVSDPFLLLQGRVPGMQIYNRGGDPNVQSTARIRGLTTAIGQAQPLDPAERDQEW